MYTVFLVLQPFAILTYKHGLLLSHFDGNDHSQYKEVVDFIKVTSILLCFVLFSVVHIVLILNFNLIYVLYSEYLNWKWKKILTSSIRHKMANILYELPFFHLKITIIRT